MTRARHLELHDRVSIEVTSMPLQTSSPSNAVPNAPKRMRLGTKSCTECRRRKIRCIYPSSNSACQECILHEAVCREQQPKRNDVPRNGDQEKMQQRLDELEIMIRRVCESVIPNSESSSLSQLKTQAADAITRLQADPIPRRRGYESSPRGSTRAQSVNWSSTGSVSTPPTDVDIFEEDAPLLQLFRQAMTVQWDNFPVGRDRAVIAGNAQVTNCVAALKCLIPNHDDLTSILKVTEQLWPVWPSQPTIQEPSSIHHLEPVTMARDFIFESLGAGKPAVAAKAVLWLALCVQQLPRDFERERPKLPTSPNNLINSYLSGAETLLTIDEGLGGSIEGLEALALKVKIYVNLGKPRKAWATARHGIDQAMLLGLHHLEDSTNQRKKYIWSFFWQFDRQLSLILGFPCAIAESHPSLSVEHTNGSVIALIVHKLSLISGHIVERNHNNRNVDYFATLKIAQELDECRREMPQQWWEAPSPDIPLAALYSLQTIKLTYFQLQKYLHLPYMLNPTPGCNFIDNRISTIEASREMVKAYQTLRNHRSSLVIMCDVMDFQVFSAVLIIIINLLSQGSSSSLQDQSADWGLVSYTTNTLKQVSQVMDCAVARQAAQLLQYILQAHDGLYAGPASYEAIIPYFGKVRISRPQDPALSIPVANRSSSVTSFSPGTIQTPLPSLPNVAYTFSPEVQFCTDPFVSFTAGPPTTDVFSDAELNIDWTAVFDGNVDYEFDQTFNIIGP